MGKMYQYSFKVDYKDIIFIVEATNLGTAKRRADKIGGVTTLVGINLKPYMKAVQTSQPYKGQRLRKQFKP